MDTAKHVSAILLVLGLAACGGTDERPAYSMGDAGYAYGSKHYGRVAAIEEVRGGEASRLGGAVGGLAGDRTGTGSGQDAGGTVSRHEGQPPMAGDDRDYRVTVITDSGERRTFVREAADLRVGDRVFIGDEGVNRMRDY